MNMDTQEFGAKQFLLFSWVWEIQKGCKTDAEATRMWVESFLESSALLDSLLLSFQGRLVENVVLLLM
jgi:hypothetical protein